MDSNPLCAYSCSARAVGAPMSRGPLSLSLSHKGERGPEAEGAYERRCVNHAQSPLPSRERVRERGC